MKTKITIIAVLACFAVVGNVIAQTVPPNVKGITAQYVNNQLTVSWEPAADPNVAFYRIYFSRQSIMQNGGDYDDYESTGSSQPSYTFPAVPYRGTTLYFSVLAVDAVGNESEAFEEEASVMIPASGTTASSSVSSSSSTSSQSSQSSPSSQSFVMTHALTTSPTELSVYFSRDLASQTVETGSIVIIDDKGTRLVIEEAVVNGTALDLKTSMQDENSAYTIASLGMISAMDGTQIVPGAPVVFRGHPKGEGDGQYTSNPEDGDTVPPEDAENLILRSVLLPNGNYRVQANWQPSANTQGDLKGYDLTSTRNDSAFADLMTKGKDEHSAEYENVPPGMFSVMVKAADLAGNLSAGITQSISLPDTGVGLAGVMLTSGAVAGFRALKRKSKR